MSAAQSLWPQDEAAPRLRPLRFHEDLTAGTLVTVEGWNEPRPFRAWQWCGRVRYALVDSGHGWLCVVPEERVRVDG